MNELKFLDSAYHEYIARTNPVRLAYESSESEKYASKSSPKHQVLHHNSHNKFCVLAIDKKNS